MTQFAVKTVALLAVLFAPLPVLYWIVFDGSTDFGRYASGMSHQVNYGIVAVCALAYAGWLLFVTVTTVKILLSKKKETEWNILQ